MGEAVGIDLGTAVSAAALRRGDDVEPRLLLPTADLAPPGDTRAALAALATRAGGGAEVPPSVGVAVPVHDPSAGAEVEAAARDFSTTLDRAAPGGGGGVVPARPGGAPGRARRGGRGRRRRGPTGGDGEHRGAARPARWWSGGRPVAFSGRTTRSRAVDMAALAIRSARVTPTDLDVAVVVGGAAWLDALAEGIEELADLAAVVDPDPQLAVACGAALLAGETGRGAAGPWRSGRRSSVRQRWPHRRRARPWARAPGWRWGRPRRASGPVPGEPRRTWPGRRSLPPEASPGRVMRGAGWTAARGGRPARRPGSVAASPLRPRGSAMPGAGSIRGRPGRVMRGAGSAIRAVGSVRTSSGRVMRGAGSIRGRSSRVMRRAGSVRRRSGRVMRGAVRWGRCVGGRVGWVARWGRGRGDGGARWIGRWARSGGPGVG